MTDPRGWVRGGKSAAGKATDVGFSCKLGELITLLDRMTTCANEAARVQLRAIVADLQADASRMADYRGPASKHGPLIRDLVDRILGRPLPPEPDAVLEGDDLAALVGRVFPRPVPARPVVDLSAFGDPEPVGGIATP